MVPGRMEYSCLGCNRVSSCQQVKAGEGINNAFQLELSTPTCDKAPYSVLGLPAATRMNVVSTRAKVSTLRLQVFCSYLVPTVGYRGHRNIKTRPLLPRPVPWWGAQGYQRFPLFVFEVFCESLCGVRSRQSQFAYMCLLGS